MRAVKKWTDKEIEFLEKYWGSKTNESLEKALGRTINAIRIKAKNLGLGSSLEYGDLVTVNQLSKVFHIDCKVIKKHWIDKCGLKAKTIRYGKRVIRKIRIDRFWEWAEQHKQVISFAHFERGSLGLEPVWVDEKRRADQKDPTKVECYRKWTNEEDVMLLAHTKSQRYTYKDLALFFNRTEGAISKRLDILASQYRPVSLDNMIKWTDDECEKLSNLYRKGYSAPAIAKCIGKSQFGVSMKITELNRMDRLQ